MSDRAVARAKESTSEEQRKNQRHRSRTTAQKNRKRSTRIVVVNALANWIQKTHIHKREREKERKLELEKVCFISNARKLDEDDDEEKPRAQNDPLTTNINNNNNTKTVLTAAPLIPCRLNGTLNFDPTQRLRHHLRQHYHHTIAREVPPLMP